jgi:hypothetical protein
MMLSCLFVGLRNQAAVQAEIIALRHQLIMLQQAQESKRPGLIALIAACGYGCC